MTPLTNVKVAKVLFCALATVACAVVLVEVSFAGVEKMYRRGWSDCWKYEVEPRRFQVEAAEAFMAEGYRQGDIADRMIDKLRQIVAQYGDIDRKVVDAELANIRAVVEDEMDPVSTEIEEGLE